MADLWIYQPAHGYSTDEKIFVSWLNDNFFIADEVADAYRLALVESGTEYVQFDETIIGGYTKQVTTVGTTDTIDDLEHLEGQLVTVYSDAAVVTTATVASGSIAIPRELFNYIVGIPFTLSIRTPRLEVPAAATTQTRIKRINETVIRHIRSQGGMAGQEYNDNSYLNNLNSVFSNKSEDIAIPTDGGLSSDAYTSIESDTPDPMTVLAAIISFTVEEVR